MSSIFQKPTVNPQRGHNGFDVSRHRSFTSPVGMLLPIFKDFANPGDKYRLNSKTFIRTEAIETAAFIRMKHHVDWFFVPFTQLYSRWNEFFNGTNDIMSSIFSSNVTGTSLPYAPLGSYMSRSIRDNEYFFNEPSTGTLVANVDEFGVPLIYNFRRLFDMLGYGNLSLLEPSNPTPTFALLDFLAYHKIFHSHYRQTDWTPNDPSIYNVDSAWQTKLISSDVINKVISTVHYRPYRKDYFTNIFPNPTFNNQFASFITSDLNSMSLNHDLNPESLYGTNTNGSIRLPNVIVDVASRGSNVNNPLFLSGTSGDGLVSTLDKLSVPDIRSLYAIDKLNRITAFAGGHYADQQLAHFGYKLPEGVSNEAYYLGSQTSDISINEVVATSTTDSNDIGGTIGDIAGKAFALTPDVEDITFTCPTHGIIMALSSIDVIPAYASMSTENYNRKKDMFDFYKPELDDLGMQPMFGDFNGESYSNSQNLSGWTYRYSEYKTNFDVVNEGFYATDKSSWVGYKQAIFDELSGFPHVLPVSYKFYLNPQYTNNIFAQEFPFYVDTATREGSDWKQLSFDNNQPASSFWSLPATLPNAVYSGDNFLIDSDIKCFKSSIMSVHSLPKLV